MSAAPRAVPACPLCGDTTTVRVTGEGETIGCQPAHPEAMPCPHCQQATAFVVVRGTRYSVPGPLFRDGTPNISRNEALRFLSLIDHAMGRGHRQERPQFEADSGALHFTIGFLTGAVDEP